MKRDLDKIQFENRREIEAVKDALDKYLTEHPNADNKDKIKELSGHLEVMHLNW